MQIKVLRTVINPKPFRHSDDGLSIHYYSTMLKSKPAT